MSARATFAAFAALLAVLAFTVLRPHATHGASMRDFDAYYAAGAAWNAGENPYSTSIAVRERALPGAPRDADVFLPFVSPPPTLPLFALLARLPYLWALRAWNLALALALAVLVAVLVRAFGITAPARVLGVALLALCFVPITSDFALGQAALPAFAAACAALAASEAATLRASFAAAFAALQPNVALPLLVGAARMRGLAMLVASAALAYLAGAYAMGWGWIAPYLAILRAHVAAERDDLIQYTPVSIAHGLGSSDPHAALAGAAIAVVALACALVAIARSGDPFERFAIVCAAVPFASAYFHEQNLLVAIVPVVYGAVRAPARLAPYGLVGAMLVAVNWLDLAQQPSAAYQSLALACAFACAYLAVRERPERMLLPAAGVGALAVLAGAFVGMHHALPLWPNAMQHFAVPAGADAADLWKLEQLQTGLLRPDAAAAGLRTMSLVGSAIVLYVASAIRYRRS